MAAGPSSVVVVGGGLAGAKTAEALREQGYAGPVTLLAAEDELPYERPPLSKEFLQGQQEFTEQIVHPGDWYGERDVDLRLGTEVVAVRAAEHTVELADGSSLEYGALVLATGSRPRRLDVPGAGAELVLRTRADSEAIKAALTTRARVVILGGGWIGLEVAAAARAAGAEVTLLESAELPLLGVLGREMAQVFADLHTSNGVDLRLGAAAAEVLVTDGRATGVRLADGTELAADVVIAGVGAEPALELANSAGLELGSGVLVDAQLRSSSPDVYAVGDIAEQQHPVLGQRVRVEHWSTALNQPAVAAAAILGKPDTYTNLPYFFSDQFDLGMEYVGLAQPGAYARVVVRGDLAQREFVAFWLDDADRLLAAMNVNVWDVADAVKPIIAGREPVDPDRLADADVPFDQLP